MSSPFLSLLKRKRKEKKKEIGVINVDLLKLSNDSADHLKLKVEIID